jgi:hypothetical protein
MVASFPRARRQRSHRNYPRRRRQRSRGSVYRETEGIVTTKYSAAGVELWSTSHGFETEVRESIPVAVAADLLGNAFVLAANVRSSPIDRSYTTLKFDHTGVVVFRTEYDLQAQ